MDLGALLTLGLLRHRPLHALRQLDILDFDDRDFDAPRLGLLADNGLQARVDLLTMRQQCVEIDLADRAAQRRLGDLQCRADVVHHHDMNVLPL